VKIAFPILLFLLHASAYLYFFVDDEGITAVYARNLIEGRGFVYAASAGPAEGYSNFLHVFVIAAILALVEAAGLEGWWVFVAGGFVSLACGALLVALVWNLSGRLGVAGLPRLTSTVVLALSGPLAVWSNSALETVPFALAFMTLIASTLPDIRRPVLTAAAAIVVMLMRADGALFAFTWLGARWIAGDHRARRVVARGVVPVCLGVALIYMAWRVWYFGSWLPLPLETKVAHKLASTDGAVVETVRSTYVRAWATRAGWPLLLGLIPAALALARRSARDRVLAALCGVLVGLFAYVALVGDWMFGFRFVVPLLAPLALVGGLGLARFTTTPAIVRVAAALAIGCGAIAAARFLDFYQRDQGKAVFWTAPSLDPAQRFGEYYEALQAVRPFVSAGDRIAYHEAGFVPFLLDVENVDMLGLTSPFVGRAPTVDAIFTDVGRYYPLTHEPAHHAVHAYLVHQQPALIVVRTRWMRSANRGRIPPQILRGYFELVHETPMFVLYRRSSRPSNPDRIAAGGFLENLAHPAYAARIAINDARVTPGGAIEAVPSLWLSTGHEVVAGPEWTLHVDPRESAPVHELYIEGHAPPEDVRLEIRLAAAGRPTLRFEHVARAGQPLLFEHRLVERHPIDTVEIRFTSLGPAAARFHLRAIRVMGQTAALRRHLTTHGIL
jgi:hypothetical protein